MVGLAKKNNAKILQASTKKDHLNRNIIDIKSSLY